MFSGYKWYEKKLELYFWFSHNTKNMPLSPWLRSHMLQFAKRAIEGMIKNSS